VEPGQYKKKVEALRNTNVELAAESGDDVAVGAAVIGCAAVLALMGVLVYSG
jgi:hypothetical protein